MCLSVVLVVVCCLPNVTPSAPCRRAVKVSRSRPSCLSSTSLFPQRVNSNISTLDHRKMTKNSALVGNTGHFDNEIDLVGSEGLDIKPQKIVSSFPLFSG